MVGLQNQKMHTFFLFLILPSSNPFSCMSRFVLVMWLLVLERSLCPWLSFISVKNYFSDHSKELLKKLYDFNMPDSDPQAAQGSGTRNAKLKLIHQGEVAHNTSGTTCHLYTGFYLPAAFWQSSEDLSTRSWACERRWWDYVYDSQPALLQNTSRWLCVFFAPESLLILFITLSPEIQPFYIYPLDDDGEHLCPVHAMAEWIDASHVTSEFMFWKFTAQDRPRLPIWPQRCAYGRLISIYLQSNIYFIISQVEFWKIPQVLSQQSPWHSRWPLTLWNPLFPLWRLPVSFIPKALGAMYNLWMGWVEHWVFKPHNRALSHLCKQWPDAQEGGFFQSQKDACSKVLSLWM